MFSFVFFFKKYYSCHFALLDLGRLDPPGHTGYNNIVGTRSSLTEGPDSRIHSRPTKLSCNDVILTERKRRSCRFLRIFTYTDEGLS